MFLLSSGNSDLRRDNIYTWSLPAWVTPLDDGRTVNTCPSAGVCAKLCYARRGAYRFGNVVRAHKRNLLMTLDELELWTIVMDGECNDPKMAGATVRIHDSGDFYSRAYLDAWLKIIRLNPHVTFYAYTKEVAMFKEVVEPDPPPNFRFIYSYGGRQDALITSTDRRADVFSSDLALQEAGFTNQEESDLLAITGPPAVGIVVNNHPGLAKSMGGQSFAELQQNRHEK